MGKLLFNPVETNISMILTVRCNIKKKHDNSDQMSLKNPKTSLLEVD